MASGAVLVASDQGAVAEVVADAAVTTDVTDPAALAAALERALTDDPLRATLRRAGPRRAAMFDGSRAAAATVAGYRVALGR
jgi:glycosyltransferase involved in cell wall biosynthesis